MDNTLFDACLIFLRHLIDSDLKGQKVVSDGYLDNFVRKHSGKFNMAEVDIRRLVKHLETIYGTPQGTGHALKKDFTEWYTQEKKNIDFHYWKRLEAFWRQKVVLPKDVILSVDKVTDEIMGFLGNPKDTDLWNRRRGLVMGHVQMGKTTNYSALISKAADAGYRIIIVLAGMTNSLRYQTQVRLDKTFVGKSSVSDAAHAKYYDVATILRGVIPNYSARYPYCGTTQLSDFNTATALAVGAHQGNFADPILFVTKKHPKVLEKITAWLKGLNHGEELDGPMLLIDDEADNASVNVNKNPEQATAINKSIRLLLRTCKQSTYIGYTATPFANIFIDPETTTKLEDEDLFPADFIKSLEPPNNYVGSQRLFSDDGDLFLDCVRIIGNDYLNLLPLNHKSNFDVPQLPESLNDAVREYIIFRSFRIATGYASPHSAMLINVSRFNYVQEQVKEKIDELLRKIRQGVETWALVDWKESPVMQDLFRVWKSEYERQDGIDITWDSIRTHLNEATISIETKLVNMKGTGIDYEKAAPTGLHLIAIGGLALSRGLTLEGLAVSYVLRNVGTADTLVQMGRWFGYKLGFEKICKIHVTQDLRDDFAAVNESIEELRTDFARMEKLGKTPYEFGLKVRQSTTGIKITAANKMRTAQTIRLAENFSIRHIQAHTLHDSNSKNDNNFKIIRDFNELLTSKFPNKLEVTKKAIVWKKIPGKQILDVLKKLDFPQPEFNDLAAEGTGLLAAYLEDRIENELSEWDIAMPYVTTAKKGAIQFPFKVAENAYCRERTGTFRVSPTIVKVNKKNTVGFGTDDFGFGEDEPSYSERVELVINSAINERPNAKKPSKTWAHAYARSRPLLLIHFLQLLPGEDFKEPLKFTEGSPIVSVAILLPDTNTPCSERSYIASKRLIEIIKQLHDESETDEELPDE